MRPGTPPPSSSPRAGSRGSSPPTGLHDLDAVQARAIRDPAWFWEAAADDIGIRWQRRPTQVLDVAGGVPWARWWRGGAFNYVDAALATAATVLPDEEAVAWEGEDGDVRRLTRAELGRAVDRAAAMLAREGVGSGTRVGIYLPMLLETVIAVLALGKLQAVYTPIFSGYAAPAVASRLRAFEATHLITADGFLRRGAVIPLKRTADAALAEAPSVRRVVVVRRLAAASRGDDEVPFDPTRDRWWHQAMAAVGPDDHAPAAETDPEAPFMVIYTSGTTGAPKGTVHVHGGFPIKAAQDLAHTFDLRAGDCLFWFTDLGWMMGPWAIAGAPLLGARLVVYEGAPGLPGPGPDLVDRRAPPGDPPRGQPDPRPGAHRPRRGARSIARSVEPAGPRLDRRAVEPGPVDVVFPRGRRLPAADRELLGRDRGRRRDRGLHADPARSGRRRSTGPAWAWASTSWILTAEASGARSASSRSGRRGPA